LCAAAAEEEEEEEKRVEEINLRARTATLMNASAHYRTTLGFVLSLFCVQCSNCDAFTAREEREKKKGEPVKLVPFIYLTVALNWQLITYSKDLIRPLSYAVASFFIFFSLFAVV
jgi:hypothetical protein